MPDLKLEDGPRRRDRGGGVNPSDADVAACATLVGMMDVETGYSTQRVAEQTGASYRQLDWWTRNDVIPGAPEAPGSGNHRRWPETLLPVISVLARVQTAFDANLPHTVLRRIAEAAFAGENELELADGVMLRWEP